MAAQQVKFYRGLQATYVVESGGTQGQDVMFNTSYAGAIYYATDSRVIFVDGTKYGFDSSSSGALQQAFVGVSYTPPTSSTNAKLVFTNLNGTEDEVELFKVASSTNAIDVSYNSSTKTYNVGLNISTNDQVLDQTDASGLKVIIGLNYDSASHQIQLTGKKDGSNQDIIIDTVDATDFVKDGMIKNVSIVNADDHGTSGRYLKIEWNADSDDHDASVAEHGLTTYVDLADFFDVITSDSSAIQIDNYVVSLVVNTSKYLEIDNGVNGKGLVFNDASIDDQFTDIKNVSINGHVIGDSIADSSLLLLSTQIPVGTITLPANLADTSVVASDSVEVAIAKINKKLAETDTALQNQIDKIEAQVGLETDGDLPDLTGTHWLKNDTDNPNEEQPDTLIDAVKNLDDHVYSIDVSIQSMDYTETSGNGDFTIAVGQEDGQISASRGWIAEQTLHGYTGPSDGSYGISAGDSINAAFAKVDRAITWNIVS